VSNHGVSIPDSFPLPKWENTYTKQEQAGRVLGQDSRNRSNPIEMVQTLIR